MKVAHFWDTAPGKKSASIFGLAFGGI